MRLRSTGGEAALSGNLLRKEALDYLDQARRVPAADLVWLKVRQAFDDLREESRFIQLCKEIRLCS
ncbi:MAG: hypothetical protein WBV97_24335, partial [Candidatus Sulfotelmatobacter sp.]